MLCPTIHRQRLIIELISEIDLADYPTMETALTSFLGELCQVLNMTPFMGPYVKHVPDGSSAFMGWMESGVQVHTWHREKLVSVDIYSCKPYSAFKAWEVVAKWLKPNKWEMR